jgi:aspartate oxidase
MSDYCHVIRTKDGLQYALEQMKGVFTQLESTYDDSNEYLETLNIATVAKAVIEAALRRPDSAGSHYMEE